jgi:DNA-directed RNA polymerase specialized sigma24 family protein
VSRRTDRDLLQEIDPLLRFELLRVPLQALGQREREVWVDVTFVGIPQSSIARRDGVSESGVAHSFRRAQRKIEETLLAAEIRPDSTKAAA